MRLRDRERLYRHLGWATFTSAISAALLAVWLWDSQWLATAGILLLAAIVLCFAGADL